MAWLPGQCHALPARQPYHPTNLSFLPHPAAHAVAARLRPFRCTPIRAVTPERPSGGGARFAAPSDTAPAAVPAAINGSSPPAIQPVVVTGEVAINGVLSPAQIYARASQQNQLCMFQSCNLSPPRSSPIFTGNMWGKKYFYHCMLPRNSLGISKSFPLNSSRLPNALSHTPPPQTTEHLPSPPVQAAEMGAYKASLPWWKIVLLGAMAGCYVALGGALLLTVAPNCPGLAQSNPGLQKYLMGAIGFPYALLIILTCGAELFTGNTALVSTALLEGKTDLKGLAKSWICSYAGNIIGCALGLMLFANTGLLPQLKNGAEMLAIYKTTAPLKETLCKAVAANWFVCLAVWQSIAAQSFGGKFIACLGPVSAFVCVGLEHCIANMFFVPLGIIVGADVSMSKFITSNLIPVTLGNIFAGVVLVAGAYSLVYGKLGKKITGEAAA